ncbi:MAG TPA: VOC family protein [Acidimicrobiales bacterium]|nr:VOC family protein [Acidimicrobiales bacterium]
MGPRLNHTIVWCRDPQVSSSYLARTLGTDAPVAWGPFLDVVMANDVTLAYLEYEGTDDEIPSQHYAFLVTENEFDQVFGRITSNGQRYWADPALRDEGSINHHDGGRGVYFKDPDGHLLEIITRPYGG